MADSGVPLPYGVYWNTIRGTKQSIVKEMREDWCAEILFLLKKLRRESISQNAFPVHLSELALGFFSKNPYYSIPHIQRGFVWNATRCEVLWDSILRGIPIGAISVRSSERGWEIFDGQQRTTAIAMGYSPWPPQNDESVLWIDLKPGEKYGRRFVFRVTTAAHPWGFNLTDDEKNDNRISVSERREAVDKLSGRWERSKIKGARPHPKEMWPAKSGLAIPFTILRDFIEKNDKRDIDTFVGHCQKNFFENNWAQHFLEEKILSPDWDLIVNAIRFLQERTIIAMNASGISPDDLGLYFKRMNKQGIEPDDEEIRYSLLKSKIPSLKQNFDDNVAKGRCRPSWMADIALRFWLAKKDNWKWRANVSMSDIMRIANSEENKDEFAEFSSTEFPSLLDSLEQILTKGNNALLSWHMAQLYRHGGSDSLVIYFMRQICEKKDTSSFIALATIVPWFSTNPTQCAKSLWDSDNIQSGLAKEIRANNFMRIFTLKELHTWAEEVKSILNRADWGNGDWIERNPYIGSALERIWYGFHGNVGCSLLIYSCRAFMKDYFDGYNAALPEWQGQNRPWDYDHILPQDWIAGRRISGYSKLVQKFLWSIGNSALLPFSLNREKQAKAPVDYPDGDCVSAKNLHIDSQRVNKFGEYKADCDKIDRDKKASAFFVETTIDRVVALIEEWYRGCGIGDVMLFDNIEDKRWNVVGKLRPLLDSAFGQSGVWFVNGEYQYELNETTDRFRPWLACGVKGTIRQKDGGIIKCILGIASNGEFIEIGARRHPEETTIPGDDTWWYADDRGSTYENIPIDEVANDFIIQKLRQLRDILTFSPEQS